MNKQAILDRFQWVTAHQDDEIDLATAALLIAAVEYPDLDIDQQLRSWIPWLKARPTGSGLTGTRSIASIT